VQIRNMHCGQRNFVNKGVPNQPMKPITLRLWIKFLAAISGLVCVLVIFFAMVGAATGNVSEDSSAAQATQTAAADLQTYDGVVTDTKCGAKHMPALHESAADCTRACVHAGEKFSLVDGDKVYTLEGEPEMLKRAAGERVTIAGTLNGNTISVASVR
jgi:hypothetical protein